MSVLNWETTPDCYCASLKLDFMPSALFVYRSWAQMGTRDAMPCILSLRGVNGEMFSDDVIVVGDEFEKRYILAGALTAYRSQTMFRVIRRGGRFHSIEAGQPSIKPGEAPEKLVVLEGSDWRELLFRYADMAAEKMGVKKIDVSANETGYCTWYYYYKEVTYNDFLENVEALGKNRSPYAAEYVQIDDGYQRRQGDWFDRCDTWPDTLEEAARKIIDRGMKPGIWLMPFVASTASRLYKDHHDWFVKEMNSDTPVSQRGWSPAPEQDWCCLDASIPEVCEHIANVFKTFWNMGYVYFKLDGLSFGLADGRRRDLNTTSVSAFRLLMKAVREAVPEAKLLACSEPFMPCLGLFDNARVSCDTSRYFITPSANRNFSSMGCDIVNSAHQSLNNFWKFDRWFRCDPDVLMARQDNAFYTFSEAKFSVLTGILTGVCFTSDHLGTISSERNTLLGIAQRCRMRDVQPLKWMLSQWPQFFEGTIDGKRAVAVFNDSENELVCDFSELGLPENCREIFTDREYAKTLTLPKHDAALLI